jgi:hypothetical protein
MAIFKGKTEEEKVAELAAQEAAREREKQQQADAEEEKKRAAFVASPAGQAMAAKAARRRYFQVVQTVSSSLASATWEGNVTRDSHQDSTGMIESVEDQGWALHDVGYVFQETGADSKSKAIGSGDRTAVSGKIVGVFLFRAVTAPLP